MKKYYVESNVNDRAEFAKTLANGEEFDIWFTAGVVRHYDENGDLISTESAKMPEDAERIAYTAERETAEEATEAETTTETAERSESETADGADSTSETTEAERTGADERDGHNRQRR